MESSNNFDCIVLRQIPLFSELNEKDLEEVYHACSLHRYSNRTLIFQEGDLYIGFYIVLEGKVKVYRLTREGKETVFHIITRPNTLAEVPMFTGGSYPAYAETVEDSTLLFVHKDGFLSRLYMYPDLAIKMLAGLSKRMRTLGNKIEELTVLNIRTRLIHFLLDEYDKQKEHTKIPMIVLPVSKSLLASQLGTMLETLSRTFKKLHGEGLIRVSGKKIFLEDVGRLKQEFLQTQ